MSEGFLFSIPYSSFCDELIKLLLFLLRKSRVTEIDMTYLAALTVTDTRSKVIVRDTLPDELCVWREREK